MKNKSQGFTLIEVLIVIVIIGIVSSVAMLTIHFNKKKQLETLANNFAGLITLAEQEAILRPTTLGLSLTKDHYQFLSYNEDQHTWQALTSHAFSKKTIPDDTQIILKLNYTIMPSDGKPRLIISQSGDIPLFTLYIGQIDQPPAYEINSDEKGEIHVK